MYIDEELREIMAHLVVRKKDELIGRIDLLRVEHPTDHAKANTLDLSAMLHLPLPVASLRGNRVARHYTGPRSRTAVSEKTLNGILLEVARPALEKGERVKATLPISNAD